MIMPTTMIIPQSQLIRGPFAGRSRGVAIDFVPRIQQNDGCSSRARGGPEGDPRGARGYFPSRTSPGRHRVIFKSTLKLTRCLVRRLTTSGGRNAPERPERTPPGGRSCLHGGRITKHNGYIGMAGSV